jgi:hypothetical protein
LAENHLPAPWCPRNEIIRIDHGGWLSSTSASDQVRPADLEPGDRIVRPDGVAVTVERTRSGGRGWVIWWYAGESASGLYDVARGERVTRLRSI